MSSLLHKPPILHGLIPSFSEGSPAPGGDGWETGNALLFDGLNDEILLNSTIDIALSQNFTCSVWAYLSSSGFLTVWTGNAANRVVMVATSSDQILLNFGAQVLFDVPAIALDTWHHLLFARSGNNARVYWNGSESSSGQLTPAGNGISINRFGVRNGGDLYYDGIMDDLYFWLDAVGTLADAVAIYNGGVPVDPETVIPNATHKYLFNESSGIALADGAAIPINGVLTNFADPDANWVSRL